MLSKDYVKTRNGEEIAIFRTTCDVNGNPRYIVHFMDLGLTMDEYNNPKFRGKVGIRKYRGKDFGGGVVIQSYSIDEDIQYLIDRIKKARGN